MGKRSRLFASAAFPLLSLSLAFEPAAAAALREQVIMPLSNDVAGSAAANAGASFEVAQEQPQGGESEEELRKHKKPGEAEQGAPQGQKHEAAPAQQREAEPQHKPKEAAPEAAPQPQKHQQEAPQPKAAEPQAAPKQQHEQPAEKPPAQKPPAQKPQAQPEAKPQPKAVEPQAQEPSQPAQKPHKQPAEQQPAAEPEAKPQPKAAPETQQQGQPEQKQHQKPQGQPAEPAQQQIAPAKQPAPAAQQPQAQQAQPETETQPAQKPHQKPQAQPAETAPQQKAPAQQPAEQQPAPATQQPQGQKAQPETQVAPGSQQGQKPGGDKTHGKPQQGEQQPAPKGEPQGQQGQQPNQAAPQTGKQPQPTNETGAPAQGTAAPAPANGTAQPNGAAAQPGVQTEVPASAPVSPQELERRKKIAENPAESKGPVILPVQNGAAVLDSDKDAARRGHRQGGQNPGGQGRGQAGQQGQAGQAPVGQGQAGQGQAVQGQNAQTPPPAAYTKPPTSDAEAQRATGGQQQPPVKMEAVTSEQGRRMDGRPNFTAPGGTMVQTIINQDNRTIVNVDNNYVVRHDDTERFVRGGERPTYEQLPRDRYRETIDQPDGDRIITVRNRYGDIIQRSRVDADGREYVLFYSPELEQQPDHDDYFRDPGDSLPPMRLLIPLSQYIIDTGSERDSDYYDFLREPPVEPVERIYSVNEVRYSARIRDKVRRIDLDTITFATGSAEIPMSQASTLRGVADAIGQIVKKDPTETFMIEGHTDAVGSPESNLILSDQRAESVAKVLSDVYGVPPENLVTQGYGEQYLKVNTQGPEQENRRVTIRRITALVRPVASNR